MERAYRTYPGVQSLITAARFAAGFLALAIRDFHFRVESLARSYLEQGWIDLEALVVK